MLLVLESWCDKTQWESHMLGGQQEKCCIFLYSFGRELYDWKKLKLYTSTELKLSNSRDLGYGHAQVNQV